MPRHSRLLLGSRNPHNDCLHSVRMHAHGSRSWVRLSQSSVIRAYTRSIHHVYHTPLNRFNDAIPRDPERCPWAPPRGRDPLGLPMLCFHDIRDHSRWPRQERGWPVREPAARKPPATASASHLARPSINGHLPFQEKGPLQLSLFLAAA